MMRVKENFPQNFILFSGANISLPCFLALSLSVSFLRAIEMLHLKLLTNRKLQSQRTKKQSLLTTDEENEGTRARGKERKMKEKIVNSEMPKPFSRIINEWNSNWSFREACD